MAVDSVEWEPGPGAGMSIRDGGAVLVLFLTRLLSGDVVDILASTWYVCHLGICIKKQVQAEMGGGSLSVDRKPMWSVQQPHLRQRVHTEPNHLANSTKVVAFLAQFDYIPIMLSGLNPTNNACNNVPYIHFQVDVVFESISHSANYEKTPILRKCLDYYALIDTRTKMFGTQDREHLLSSPRRRGHSIQFSYLAFKELPAPVDVRRRWVVVVLFNADMGAMEI
ncbi:uncharacterized protein CLUP02_10225 [Colletotrichum lupini]|uniref:Uncharacterized protein n=1 Tax=Colletotrichum lupini TaxID=145971 RepID=A0A9Q8WIK4_9PEZI|nr:uncharacterized protein CLUP02_10225 [Colletotrichum lupini]UQC84729.1 hypothetical protein CLUP02_10225 [Colletotrichum lupini]